MIRYLVLYFKSFTIIIDESFSTGSVLVERVASVEEGFSQEAPLVYNFGQLSPDTNMTLYNILVSRMAKSVMEKMEANRKGKLVVTFCDEEYLYSIQIC